MNISVAEYKLLKKFYRKKELIVKNDISDILERKHFIEIIEAYLNDDGSEKSFKYVITNDGVVAFEIYRESHIKYWIPIIISNLISIASLIISIIALKQ